MCPPGGTSPGKRLKTALNEVLGESVNFQRNSYICGANSFTLFLGFVYPYESLPDIVPRRLVLFRLRIGGSLPYLTPKNSLQTPRGQKLSRDTGSPGRVLFEGVKTPLQESGSPLLSPERQDMTLWHRSTGQRRGRYVRDSPLL